MLQLPKSKIPMLIQSFLFSYAPSRQDFDAPSIFFQTNLVPDIIGSCAFTDFLLRTARRRLSRVTKKKRNGEFNQNTCRRFKRGDVHAATWQCRRRSCGGCRLRLWHRTARFCRRCIICSSRLAESVFHTDRGFHGWRVHSSGVHETLAKMDCNFRSHPDWNRHVELVQLGFSETVLPDSADDFPRLCLDDRSGSRIAKKH